MENNITTQNVKEIVKKVVPSQLTPFKKGWKGGPGRPKMTEGEKLKKKELKRTIKQVLEEAIPLEKLARVNREGLNATFTDKFNDNAPDHNARHKYLETTYKVLGAFPKEGPTVAVQVNFKDDD